MKEVGGFVQWLARLTALTAFALGLAILWELPHYETLVGLPQRGQNRIWLLGVLWAKTLLPVAAAFLACAAFHRSRYRRSASQAFWAATLLAFIWLLGDLWCQLRYGAEASSYLPFVVAALRGGAAERHVQWVGDPGVVAASLFVWLALGALAIACLRVASRFGWATLAARAPRLTGDRAARALVGSWCVAVLVASFGIQQLEPRPVRESLVFYLPFPFGWPFDRIVNGGASAACEGPDVLGVVPYSWEGGHQPELVLRNSCPGVLSLDGWSSETQASPRTPLGGSIGPGELLTVSLPKKAFSRDGMQAVRLRTPEGQIFAQIAFEKEGIERGEMVANPGLESAHISRVEAAAQHAYRNHFAAMRSPRPVRSSPSHSQDFPNVVLLVMESFRPDVVNPDIMPRLDQRSAQGLRAQRHYSGSNTSHLGLFSLLYARSGLAYDAILDGPSSDHASLLFRELGYRTYFLSSGGIVGWRRMDEYLNRPTFDEVEMLRSDSGQVWRDWPQNDRRLLEAARERLETASQPVFIVGFLMSLHFPYPYPESYERFLPVSHEDQLADWPSLFAARLDRDKLWNRYRNAAAAFDATLDEFLESIDLEKTLVVVTGDHGESFGEDGTLVHGSRPSDVQTRVPLVMLGGGVSAREIDGSTSHVDVLPTLLRIASGASSTGLGFEGRDLGGPIGDEPVLVRLHKVNEPAPVLIVHGDERLLLRARTDRPVLDAVGFVDANGTPVTDAGPVDDGRWTLVVQQALGGSAGSAPRR